MRTTRHYFFIGPIEFTPIGVFLYQVDVLLPSIGVRYNGPVVFINSGRLDMYVRRRTTGHNESLFSNIIGFSQSMFGMSSRLYRPQVGCIHGHYYIICVRWQNPFFEAGAVEQQTTF